MLHAGHKVDVQVLAKRTKDATTPDLLTALENMEVLSVSAKLGQGDNLPVVTLLAKPGDADILGLADSGAHLRLVLRNSLDDAKHKRAPLSIPAIMQTGTAR